MTAAEPVVVEATRAGGPYCAGCGTAIPDEQIARVFRAEGTTNPTWFRSALEREMRAALKRTARIGALGER